MSKKPCPQPFLFTQQPLLYLYLVLSSATSPTVSFPEFAGYFKIQAVVMYGPSLTALRVTLVDSLMGAQNRKCATFQSVGSLSHTMKVKKPGESITPNSHFFLSYRSEFPLIPPRVLSRAIAYQSDTSFSSRPFCGLKSQIGNPSTRSV